MDMVVRSAGEPRFDLEGFVGGIVIHDDVNIEPFGDLSIDLFEEVQELDRIIMSTSRRLHRHGSIRSNAGSLNSPESGSGEVFIPL